MALPANIYIIAEYQDSRGFKALQKIALFDPDVTSGLPDIGNTTIASLVSILTTASTGIFATLQAMSNAKMVRQGLQFDFNYAQEPTSESGTYQLVQQNARLEFGDGMGGFQRLGVPAPADGLFLTSADNNKIVVDPGSSLLNNFLTAMAQTTAQGAIGAATVGPLNRTPRGGGYGAQFFGGQVRDGKPRRRRVLQGK